MKNKNLDVGLLPETHSDKENERDWGLLWEGQYVSSHGPNGSAGVSFILSKAWGNKHEIMWVGTGTGFHSPGEY